MSSVNDFLVTAGRDYELCIQLEPSFPKDYAVSAASFHIQQAIEKILKAGIMLMGETPEHTNSIRKLSDCCTRLGIKIPEGMDDIADSLTIWETANRYDSYITFSQNKYETSKKIYLELRNNLDICIKAINSLCDNNQEIDDQPDLNDGPQMIM